MFEEEEKKEGVLLHEEDTSRHDQKKTPHFLFQTRVVLGVLVVSLFLNLIAFGAIKLPSITGGTALMLGAVHDAVVGKSGGSEEIITLGNSNELSATSSEEKTVSGTLSPSDAAQRNSKKEVRLSSPKKKDTKTSVTLPILTTINTEEPLTSLAPPSVKEKILPTSSPPAPPAAAPSQEKKVACTFDVHATTTHHVVLNEVAWMGSPAHGDETASAAAEREWIELKNISGNVVDLSGWQLLDQKKNVQLYLPQGRTLLPGAFFILERKSDLALPRISADAIYSGTLSNGGVWLKLFSASCVLVDEVDATNGWPGGSNVTKKTLERNRDGKDWHTSTDIGGTPNMENTDDEVVIVSSPTPAPSPASASGGSGSGGVSPAPPASPDDSVTPGQAGGQAAGATTHMLISALQTTGGSGNADHDFITLYNPGTTPIDIGGAKLRKRTQSGTESSIRVIDAGVSVAPGGSFTWGNSKEGFASNINADTSSTQTLSDNTSVAFLSKDGAIIDAVAWGSGQTNPFIEGTGYPDNPAANQLLKRRLVNGVMQDTGSNANDFELQ